MLPFAVFVHVLNNPKGRQLKFSRWHKRKRNINIEEHVESKLYHDENDSIYSIGKAEYTFAFKSYPYISIDIHSMSLEYVGFDLDMNCIRALHDYAHKIGNKILIGMDLPKAIELRIPFDNILGEMIYCVVNDVLIISMSHPIQTFEVFDDLRMMDFDTEPALCERIERAISDQRYARSMLIRIKCQRNALCDELIGELQRYKLLKVTTERVKDISPSNGGNMCSWTCTNIMRIIW